MGIYTATVLEPLKIVEVINSFVVKILFYKREILVTTYDMLTSNTHWFKPRLCYI